MSRRGWESKSLYLKEDCLIINDLLFDPFKLAVSFESVYFGTPL